MSALSSYTGPSSYPCTSVSLITWGTDMGRNPQRSS